MKQRVASSGLMRKKASAYVFKQGVIDRRRMDVRHGNTANTGATQITLTTAPVGRCLLRPQATRG